MASIAVLLTAGLVPAFAESANQVPLAPTNLNATPLSSNQIALTWNSPLNATQSGITGYQIEQNGQILVNDTGNTTTNYVDAGLLPGNMEQYQVAAWNAVGLGLFSNNASAVIPVTINSTQTTTQEPTNTTSYIFRGNWTNYAMQHRDHNGTGIDNQTLPYFDSAHVGQFVNSTNNKLFNGQRNDAFYPVHNSSPAANNFKQEWIKSSPIANNFQQKWIQHIAQYKIHQVQVVQQFKDLNRGTIWPNIVQYQAHPMQVVQQFENLNKGAPNWSNQALAEVGDHQVAKLTDKHLIPDWMADIKQWDH